MGQAGIFTPPPIHRSNMVIFPQYFQKSRIKQFIKTIQGQYTSNKDGLVTVVNDHFELHYQVYHRHIDLSELNVLPKALPDATRCLEFLKYESYLLQKPIYANNIENDLRHFFETHGFRMLDEEEKTEIYEGFWQKEPLKA
ncbi:hypothetical protein [Ammoniphilus sp. CFH 90114]|uniref:hypothetical protein n=1 Tax=Ammoniphilus sp. CFH 90114 TaxID=2493665 RepID=UPI00100DB5A7|nr:hypothetical protein [Ammoniphilus sp. CFH 90114]RXT15053.1 hypothetical protein EIZ39_02270 [Ammoniphilus sp. CFH 90114]